MNDIRVRSTSAPSKSGVPAAASATHPSGAGPVPTTCARDARRFAAAIAGLQLVLWPDDGHLPMEEHPDRSAAAVAKFLTSAR